MNDLLGALWVVSGYLPAIVLYLAGIAIAIYRWRLHPEVSAFAAVGCALHLIGALFGPRTWCWSNWTRRPRMP